MKKKLEVHEKINSLSDLWHFKGILFRELVRPVRNLIAFVDSLLEHWFFSKFLSPIFTYVPPAITMIYFTKNPVKEWFSSNLKLFADFFDSYAGTCLIFSVMWLPLWQRIREFIKYAGSKPIESSNKELTRLLLVFENIVAYKALRFSNAVKELIEGNKDVSYIFNKITQPEQQIEEIVQQIFSYFSSLDDDSKYKVNLALIEDEKISSIKFFYPRSADVRTPIEILNNDNSCIRISARTGKIVIIEDVEHEQKASRPRYVVANDVETKPGSLICFPIKSVVNNKVVFVISIFCETPKKFKDDKDSKKYYTELMKRFSARIILEHNLLVLKGAVNEKR